MPALRQIDSKGLFADKNGLAFAVLVMHPVIFFNWGLLAALRNA